MPTIDDILVELDNAIDLADDLKDAIFQDQLYKIRDMLINHDRYMKGKKYYNQEFAQKVKIPKSLIKTMHNDSISCMKKNPNDKYHKSACECVHWNSHFDQNSMTLHTHTIPDVDYPSEADIKTTNNLNKNNLCIINVSDKTVTCYNKADNFEKITQQDTY